MKIRPDLIAFLTFMILVFLIILFSIIVHEKKGQERKEESKAFRDSLFADLSLFGEVVEVNIANNGGRPTLVWCIKIIESSSDSLFIYNQELRTAFKIQQNLAVMVSLTKDHDKLKFIDVNINFPGMITLYDENLEIILQDSLNSRFGIGYLLEQDMKICDHHIKD